jgi:hypothetical protein
MARVPLASRSLTDTIARCAACDHRHANAGDYDREPGAHARRGVGRGVGCVRRHRRGESAAMQPGGRAWSSRCFRCVLTRWVAFSTSGRVACIVVFDCPPASGSRVVLHVTARLMYPLSPCDGRSSSAGDALRRERLRQAPDRSCHHGTAASCVVYPLAARAALSRCVPPQMSRVCIAAEKDLSFQASPPRPAETRAPVCLFVCVWVGVCRSVLAARPTSRHTARARPGELR